jgi:hypothetical protein
MWDTYRKGFPEPVGNLPEDLQQAADAIAAFVMPAVIAGASGVAFGETWTPGSGWAYVVR